MHVDTRGARARATVPTNTLQLTVRRAVLNLSALPVIDHVVGRALVGKSVGRIQDVLGKDRVQNSRLSGVWQQLMHARS